jgi:hypothetical protein
LASDQKQVIPTPLLDEDLPKTSGPLIAQHKYNYLCQTEEFVFYLQFSAILIRTFIQNVQTVALLLLV